MTIRGIGDNRQLDTLLAAALGEPVDPAWLAAAGTGAELEPVEPIRCFYNLHRGFPADFPVVGGRRVIGLARPPFRRTWKWGRSYPGMVPELTVTGRAAGTTGRPDRA